MLKILEVANKTFETSVETNDYVPLSVVTYNRPLGAKFYRAGNFDTSLIEIAVDPESGALRGFSVISFSERFEGQMNAGRVVPGIPVTDLSRFSQSDVIDDLAPFSLGLLGNTAVVAMTDFEISDTIAVCGDLKFHLSMNTLAGLTIENLGERDVVRISEHLARMKR
ncbi:hypothetical protein [Pararhizobium gei]|uniref:hypothetical protein n=1 Tax=Pararhizobium gei TaxID=1395951 RepID=UPI0023DB297E|nr:hypothetical protein [Rhizobium gei]